MLKTGKAALITDSGTPLISDPGLVLIEKAIKNGADIIALPGPTAFVPALVASGIDPQTFIFVGFPPRKKSGLISFLESLAAYRHTLIFYESPRRVENFLRTAQSVLGNRRFCLGKEISKKHEKMIRGELGSLDTVLKTEILLGEIVVILEGAVTEIPESEKPEIRSREDIFRFFKDKHGISKNTIKKALMEK
jgi:16S rRNA (cytidine1402-2'-O)-methyltransferase